jgi:hypothetical protein
VSGLVFPPNYLIGLSAQMGVDLTPNDDLEERLEIFLKESQQCIAELEVLRDSLEHYAHSIKGLDVEDLKRKTAQAAQANTDGDALV